MKFDLLSVLLLAAPAFCFVHRDLVDLEATSKTQITSQTKLVEGEEGKLVTLVVKANGSISQCEWHGVNDKLNYTFQNVTSDPEVNAEYKSCDGNGTDLFNKGYCTLTILKVNSTYEGNWTATLTTNEHTPQLLNTADAIEVNVYKPGKAPRFLSNYTEVLVLPGEDVELHAFTSDVVAECRWISPRKDFILLETFNGNQTYNYSADYTAASCALTNSTRHCGMRIKNSNLTRDAGIWAVTALSEKFMVETKIMVIVGNSPSNPSDGAQIQAQVVAILLPPLLAWIFHHLPL